MDLPKFKTLYGFDKLSTIQEIGLEVGSTFSKNYPNHWLYLRIIDEIETGITESKQLELMIDKFYQNTGNREVTDWLRSHLEPVEHSGDPSELGCKPPMAAIQRLTLFWPSTKASSSISTSGQAGAAHAWPQCRRR